MGSQRRQTMVDTLDVGNAVLIREIIGRDQKFKRPSVFALSTADRTRPNYAFWDQFRHGKIVGYEYAALFCQPIAQIIASHVIGGGVLLRLSDDALDVYSQARIDATNDMLARLSRYLGAFFTNVLVDLYALGDQMLLCNPDGSIVQYSPETVDLTYDYFPMRAISKAVITQRLPHYTVTDTYTAETRVIEYKWNYGNPHRHRTGHVTKEVYANPLGRVPVVHFASLRGANEVYGRPLWEALLPLFSIYNDLIEKGFDGAELMGNPVPVMTGVKNPEAVKEKYASDAEETYQDKEGTEVVRDMLTYDARMAAILGEGADFKFATPPPGFTTDVRAMLKLAFLLIMDYTRISEPLWGGAVPYQSGVQQQMVPFYQYIDYQRLQIEGVSGDDVLGLSPWGGLHELARIWLSWQALTNPQIALGATASKWEPLSQHEYEERRRWAEMLYKAGGVSTVRLNTLSELVEDPETAYREAQEELQASPDYDDFQGRLDQALARLAGDSTDTEPEAVEHEAVQT